MWETRSPVCPDRAWGVPWRNVITRALPSNSPSHFQEAGWLGAGWSLVSRLEAARWSATSCSGAPGAAMQPEGARRPAGRAPEGADEVRQIAEPGFQRDLGRVIPDVFVKLGGKQRVGRSARSGSCGRGRAARPASAACTFTTSAGAACATWSAPRARRDDDLRAQDAVRVRPLQHHVGDRPAGRGAPDRGRRGGAVRPGSQFGSQSPVPRGNPVAQLTEKVGGRSRARTCDPGLVRAVLSQLSYPPVRIECTSAIAVK